MLVGTLKLILRSDQGEVLSAPRFAEQWLRSLAEQRALPKKRVGRDPSAQQPLCVRG